MLTNIACHAVDSQRPSQTVTESRPMELCRVLWPASGPTSSPVTLIRDDWCASCKKGTVPSASPPSQGPRAESKLLPQGTGKATAPTTTRADCRPALRSVRGCVASRVEVVLIVGPGAPDWWVYPIEIPPKSAPKSQLLAQPSPSPGTRGTKPGTERGTAQERKKVSRDRQVWTTRAPYRRERRELSPRLADVSKHPTPAKAS